MYLGLRPDVPPDLDEGPVLVRRESRNLFADVKRVEPKVTKHAEPETTAPPSGTPSTRFASTCPAKTRFQPAHSSLAAFVLALKGQNKEPRQAQQHEA
jgi:hypothetical protein